jgi:hypothetical protein
MTQMSSFLGSTVVNGSQIHQLRSLLPDRLLAPLIPIVNPRKADGRATPKSPQALYESLAQCARDGVAEVEGFKSMWQSPELKPVWDWMDQKLNESNGQYPQPTGMWERDYDIILRNLENEDRQIEEQRQKEEEEQERLQALSAEGGWRGVIESFEKRQLPGLRLLVSKNEAMIKVHLGMAGMRFDVQEVVSPEDAGAIEWQVETPTQLAKTPSRLETAICANLNRRPRKWDLAYLLVSLLIYLPGRDGIFPADGFASGHDLFVFRYQANTVQEVRKDDRQFRSASCHPPPDDSRTA